jgi:hypothetical protein
MVGETGDKRRLLGSQGIPPGASLNNMIWSTIQSRRSSSYLVELPVGCSSSSSLAPQFPSPVERSQRLL